MKYIEVTEKFRNIKVLFPLETIVSVSEDEESGAFIETGYDKRGESTGIFTVESYSEIVKQIKLLQGA